MQCKLCEKQATDLHNDVACNECREKLVKLLWDEDGFRFVGFTMLCIDIMALKEIIRYGDDRIERGLQIPRILPAEIKTRSIKNMVNEMFTSNKADGEKRIEAAKAAGRCMKCSTGIPVGGRPIKFGTSALCESCSKTMSVLVNLQMKKSRILQSIAFGMIDGFSSESLKEFQLAKAAGECVACENKIPVGGRLLNPDPITGEVMTTSLCSSCSRIVWEKCKDEQMARWVATKDYVEGKPDEYPLDSQGH